MVELQLQRFDAVYIQILKRNVYFVVGENGLFLVRHIVNNSRKLDEHLLGHFVAVLVLHNKTYAALTGLAVNENRLILPAYIRRVNREVVVSPLVVRADTKSVHTLFNSVLM